MAARARLLERAAAGLTNEQLAAMMPGALARLVALGTVAHRQYMMQGMPGLRTELVELMRACEHAGCFCPEQRMGKEGFADAWVELLDAAKAAMPVTLNGVPWLKPGELHGPSELAFNRLQAALRALGVERPAEGWSGGL